MPGRGNYWQVGGLPDETVKEVDLTQAVQTKLNSGGGGSGVFELIKTVTLGDNADPAVITPDTPITFADYSEIELVVSGKLVTADGQIEITINNTDANSLYEWHGSIVGASASAFVEHPSDPSWRLNNVNMAQDSLFYLKIILGGVWRDYCWISIIT